ncbi:hypothetical protein M426DRAFT_322834 [Hypoxylon sp. CI-4A]|nr:hypothetical protein M426DRAFT_322834 [Hypoxylon sp. CI-4A]
MTEVVPADRTKLLQSKRAECNTIVRSRKRKLCILYAVATTPDGLPQRSFDDPDAPPTNAAESQFLEGSDILQGKRLNESTIPTRQRIRSEYPALPRPGESYLPSDSTHHSTAAKKKDVGPVVRPIMPPAAVVSRPGIGDGQTNSISSALPNSNNGFEQSPPSWPIQPTNRPTGPDLPSNATPVKDRSPPKFPPSERTETAPQNHRLDGPPKTPMGLPASSSSLTQLQGEQMDATKQQQLQNSNSANAQQQDLRDGEPMDIDVAQAVSRTENNGVGTAQSTPQPDVARPVNNVSSTGPTSQTPISTIVHDTRIGPNTGPDIEKVPFAGTTEAGQIGMKGVALAGQSSQDSAPSGSFVAGPSESIPGEVKPHSISLPTNETMKSPSNGIKDTNGIVNAVQPQRTSPPTSTIYTPASNVASSVDTQNHISGLSTNLLQPVQQSAGRTSLDSSVSTVAENQQSNSQPAILSASQANDKDNHDGGRDNKVEATEKQSSIASISPDQATPEIDSREPRRSPTPVQEPLQLGRRRTSSLTGVARQKPVSEILSEPPKALKESEPHHATLITPTSQSSKQRPLSLLKQDRLKEKSKRSTVVFGKQPKRDMDPDKSVVQNRPKSDQMASDDYFTPLFVQAFTSNSKWMRPMDQILHQSHKTLSTPDTYTHIFDNQACKILKRVYQLQHHNKWSLRQPKRCPEPTRQPGHWDVLLKEMKWMRTDFREERKWKMAAARNLAEACAEWVSASPEDRKDMQVNSYIPPLETSGDAPAVSTHVRGQQSADNHPTPDLVPSADPDSPLEPDDEPHEGIIDTIAPSAIFALESDDVVFTLHQSASAERLLEELPMYGSPLKVPKSDLISPEYDPDASWRRPALPLSRFVEGRMELTPTEPPKKRSRYQYVQEDDEDNEVVFGEPSDSQTRLDAQNPNVALFRPENKSFRDRLHAGHQFRPPNEHTMPFQSFYESRSPSQWIQSEDDELKGLVREYSYNWSLISNILSSKAMFNSGAERRTPWECFERWVMLEGLPHDMQKTQYFKLWQGRIDASQQVIKQQQNAMQQQAQQQQQQAGPNGPVTPIPKRRYNIPLKVERRRNQKHLTMIDAMRRLAKKRETAIQKQQHAASLAAMRKTNEPPQPRGPTKTPREYSIMRFERDQAMAERLAERMAQQQRAEAQRRAALQRAHQQGQVAQLAAAQNANQMSQSNSHMAASHPHANIARVNAPNQISINGQGRARMPIHTPNGAGTPNHMNGGLVPPMQMNGTPQVQMPTVNGQSRMQMPTAQPDIQLLMQAQQISEQQRRSVQMRQQQGQQGQQQPHQNHQGNMPLQSSPPAMRAAAMNGLNQKNYLNNVQTQAMMASFSPPNGSGMSTPPAPGLSTTSQSVSPRPNATMPQPTHHQTYVSQLQHIESQIRQSHPNTPQDMVREMARQLLNNRHNNHNLAQSAMNAAAGGTGHAAAANGPHQYAQLLRAQQQQQAQAAAAAQQAQQQAAQHQRNSSGSATPTPSIPK